MKRSILNDTKLMLSFVWNNNKSIVFLKIILVIIENVKMILGTVYLKIIIDAIMNGKSLRDVLFIIAVLQVISFILYLIINIIGKRVIPKKEYILKNNLQNIFIKKAMKQDIESYENYKYYDEYTKAYRFADKKALDILNIIVGCFSSILSCCLLLSLIASLDVILLFFVLVTIILTLFDQVKSGRCSNELYEAEQSINRRSEYLKKVSNDRRFAKEVRVFNMYDFIINKLNETFIDKYNIFKKSNKKYWNIKLTVSILNTLIIIPSVLLYLTYKTINNNFSIGDFSMLFASIFTISQHIASILSLGSNLNFESKYYISHLRVILDYKPKIEMTGKEVINSKKLHSIEFKNVTFIYPGHEGVVLDNVSFKIEEGEKLAIVGKNGAGKSTIIKLLLRLYDVTSGEIFVDGINIKLYNVNLLRKAFSTILQDFNIYAFTVAENVLMSEYSVSDDEKIKESLGLAGILEKVEKMPYKNQTYITREFNEEGEELSGGELQKMAIARAYNNDSSFLILDEPNSSLDPIAEYELNNQIMNTLTNKSAIFISHRLSTTIFADKIIYIEKGKIIEMGTHEDLIKLNGSYAKMYSTQSKAYRLSEELKKYE